MTNKRTTIFRQLITSILLPVVVILILLGTYNYFQNKKNLENWHYEKTRIIFDEITQLHKFQDLALKILESNLDIRLKHFSDILIKQYFNDAISVEKLNLDSIRHIIGMNPDMEDIYIINRGGYVINTTFRKDLHLNLFAFGAKHKRFLTKVFSGNKYVSDRIAIENTTKRLKKYSYQPTSDEKYLIELGAYSTKADQIVDFIRKRLLELPEKQSSIIDIDIFIGSERPFSLYKRKTKIRHKKLVQTVFKTKQNKSVVENENGKKINYDYIFLHRDNSSLYSGSVIQIKSDKSVETKLLKNEMLKFLLVFGVSVIIILFLIYNNSRLITKPIKTLAYDVEYISKGHLNKRTNVSGRNEITTLSEQFNKMISQLESYTNELEEKVRERTAEIIRQKEIVEIQNKNIFDSIRYAKKIQNAILPAKDSFNDVFKEYFIFFRPRDIVSGDFYFLQVINDHVVIAAADCTGHGVPGAFMSMLGIAFLNEIVRRREVTKVNEVLNLLRQQIKKSLKQTGGRRETKDGIDMAICVINKQTLELQFSGAYNPMYLVRHGKLLVYDGDRMPVGIYRKEKDSFTNHEIQLQKGDTIYLFTDGIIDQLNEKTKQKFMKNRFKQLIMEISSLSMPEQKQRIEDVFNKWKGGYKQIDDVLVIGIKIS